MQTLKRIILNVWFYALFLPVHMLAIPLLTLGVAVQRPFRSQRRTMRQFRRTINVYGKLVIRLAYPLVRVERDGFGWRPGELGPSLVVCNHRSTSDPYLMAYLPCELVQVVNKWPFRLPVLGVVARWAGYLSIREMPVDEFYEHAERLLRDGVSIVAFPEGTRSGSRVMGPFHGSMFRLALRAGVPIVPLCISGNERTPPKGKILLEPGVVRMRLLPAVPPEEFRNMSAFQLKNHVRRLIADELGRMEGAA